MKEFTTKISLIVPIYNTSIFLEKCLNSIRNQTFKEFEVILVNDGSTDNSESFCKEYIKSDNRFVLKTKENGGLSSALNYGLKFARGEYIGIVDSDDYISDDYCEILYSLAKEKNVDLLNFGYRYVKNENFDERCSKVALV
jgi:glycosyltransferase involved in cell wall biosynthesis